MILAISRVHGWFYDLGCFRLQIDQHRFGSTVWSFHFRMGNTRLFLDFKFLWEEKFLCSEYFCVLQSIQFSFLLQFIALLFREIDKLLGFASDLVSWLCGILVIVNGGASWFSDTASSRWCRVGKWADLLCWFWSCNLLIGFTVTYTPSLRSVTLCCFQIVAGSIPSASILQWCDVLWASVWISCLKHGIGVVSWDFGLLVLFCHQWWRVSMLLWSSGRIISLFKLSLWQFWTVHCCLFGRRIVFQLDVRLHLPLESWTRRWDIGHSTWRHWIFIFRASICVYSAERVGGVDLLSLGCNFLRNLLRSCWCLRWSLAHVHLRLLRRCCCIACILFWDQACGFPVLL